MEKEKTKDKKQTEKPQIERKENVVGTIENSDSSLEINSDFSKGQFGKTKNITNRIAHRGRVFQGRVIRKFPGRITIELDRTVYIHKYERYMVKKTRIHARLPKELNAEIGDLVKVQECRPLSKIIHFLALEIIRKKGEK